MKSDMNARFRAEAISTNGNLVMKSPSLRYRAILLFQNKKNPFGIHVKFTIANVGAPAKIAKIFAGREKEKKRRTRDASNLIATVPGVRCALTRRHQKQRSENL